MPGGSQKNVEGRDYGDRDYGDTPDSSLDLRVKFTSALPTSHICE